MSIIFFILICHCHIRFPYRMKKIIKSITINILGHGGEVMRRKWVYEDYIQ